MATHSGAHARAITSAALPQAPRTPSPRCGVRARRSSPQSRCVRRQEFRTAVENLGISFPTTTADIDAVFDTFDEDGGGYMDTDEATAMIKGLQVRQHNRVLIWPPMSPPDTPNGPHTHTTTNDPS